MMIKGWWKNQKSYKVQLLESILLILWLIMFEYSAINYIIEGKGDWTLMIKLLIYTLFPAWLGYVIAKTRKKI